MSSNQPLHIIRLDAIHAPAPTFSPSFQHTYTEYATTPPDTPTIIERIKDADVVVTTRVPINEETVRTCPKLRLVAVMAIGMFLVFSYFCVLFFHFLGVWVMRRNWEVCKVLLLLFYFPPSSFRFLCFSPFGLRPFSFHLSFPISDIQFLRARKNLIFILKSYIVTSFPKNALGHIHCFSSLSSPILKSHILQITKPQSNVPS